MPLRYQGGVWWVRARLSTVIDTPGLSLAAVADQITSGGIDSTSNRPQAQATSCHWPA
jgi:hypothetical protein